MNPEITDELQKQLIETHLYYMGLIIDLKESVSGIKTDLLNWEISHEDIINLALAKADELFIKLDIEENNSMRNIDKLN